MPNVTVTIRELKNVESGLDLSIPSHTEIPGLIKTTLECNVVAVSNLSCFKGPQHNEGDVVQFMVSKQLEDFDAFRKRLVARFPGTNFPSLPKSLFSFVEGTTKQQVAQLEQFLHYVAVTSRLAKSVENIQFLGFSSISARKLAHKQKKDNTLEESRSDVGAVDLFQEDDDEDDDDLFRPALISPTHHVTGPSQRGPAVTKLFADQDYGGQVARDDELVLVAGATDDPAYHKNLLHNDDLEDDDDLLNIDDNLDELRLFATKSKVPNMKPSQKQDMTSKPTPSDNKPTTAPKPGGPKPDKPIPASKPGGPKPDKPIPAHKPVLMPKPTGTKPATPKERKETLFLDTQDSDSIFTESPSTIMVAKETDLFGLMTDDGGETALGTEDIMKYIQENTAEDKDLDLFS